MPFTPYAPPPHRADIILGETDRQTISRRQEDLVLSGRQHGPDEGIRFFNASAMIPAERGLENASRRVFLTIPQRVARKMNPS